MKKGHGGVTLDRASCPQHNSSSMREITATVSEEAFSHGVAFSCSGFPPKPECSFQDFSVAEQEHFHSPKNRSVNNLGIVWFSLHSSLVNKEKS